MNQARAYEHVEALGKVLEGREGAFLHWDLAGDQEVRIDKFRFPPGWSPRRADIVFDLPDDYPQNQPTVYIQGDLRWEGDRPHTMYPPKQHGHEERFARYCIHELSWDPREDDLVSLLDTLEVSLQDPSARRAVED